MDLFKELVSYVVSLSLIIYKKKKFLLWITIMQIEIIISKSPCFLKFNEYDY